MKINKVSMLVEEISIGGIFRYEDKIWIKTNSSHDKAGYQCVEMHYGNLSYIDKGTKVIKVDAELQVLT